MLVFFEIFDFLGSDTSGVFKKHHWYLTPKISNFDYFDLESK